MKHGVRHGEMRELWSKFWYFGRSDVGHSTHFWPKRKNK